MPAFPLLFILSPNWIYLVIAQMYAGLNLDYAAEITGKNGKKMMSLQDKDTELRQKFKGE